MSELNLRQHDLVNLGLVTRIRAPWLLVADIERGGVFASVIGTIGLLSADERSLFRGFAINKFRGDVSLFDEGVKLLEERTAAPCLGVFPYTTELYLDAEDSLALSTRPRGDAPPGGRIAIVRFPHLSNATDFRLLTWADWLTSPVVERVRRDHSARHEKHHRRLAVAAQRRTRQMDSVAASRRCDGCRYLRWVSDARQECPRPGRRRVGSVGAPRVSACFRSRRH